MKGQTWRLVVTIVLVAVGFIGLWNTLKYWTLSSATRSRMEQQKPGSVQELERKAMKLGLDLQGGLHVVLRVEKEKIEASARDDAVDRAIQVLRNRIDFTGVTEPMILKQGDDRIIVDLPGYTDASQAEHIIGQTAQLEFKLLESMDNATLILKKIDSVVTAATKVGTQASTSTAQTGEKAAASGDTSSSELFADLLKSDAAEEGDSTALEGETPLTQYLEVFLYSSKNNTPWPGYVVAQKDRALVEKILNMAEVKRVIPDDVQLAWSTRSDIRSAQTVYFLYILKNKVQFLGKNLERIALGRGSTQEPTVNFRLSGQSAASFARLTGANIDKPLAIVIDNKVESAPFINSKIRNEGQITMGSSATIQDAQNLEIVLKAGALPAPVEIIEKDVIGPTLGSDSIRKGLTSSIVGLIAVFLLVGIYYRISGLIADIGLLFNIFFLLAVMAGVGATLTMPGIAGIILTIGISVDSNILIFERIREELRSGKTVRASIDAGYNRALLTIIDSHVTTLITAGALFLFGAGPIKGFAVSLFWGVTISLYTAVVVTKMIFDLRKGYQTLSI